MMTPAVLLAHDRNHVLAAKMQLLRLIATSGRAPPPVMSSSSRRRPAILTPTYYAGRERAHAQRPDRDRRTMGLEARASFCW